jgi:hypothetical protein
MTEGFHPRILAKTDLWNSFLGMRQRRMPPEEAVLEKITRYEAHLSRQMLQGLHTLERLQAARAGQQISPMLGTVQTAGAGDRMKAAFSDALKRAAVKLGIGRFLYHVPGQWVDYDRNSCGILGKPMLIGGRHTLPPAPVGPPSPAPAPKGKTPADPKAKMQSAECKTALYKGRVYRLLRQETNQQGKRVQLAFLDGSKEFWADASLVRVHEPKSSAEPSPRVNGAQKPVRTVVTSPESNCEGHSEQDIPF